MPESKYFRISVTNKCNLSCHFCHREGNFDGRADALTPEDIQFVCSVALSAGFGKFKITGGEPTEREDLDKIIALLSLLNLPDLSMITNGTNLSKQAKRLWDAGLRRLNITVNTLDEQRFLQFGPRKNITVQSIIDGIEVALIAGFKDTKINFVFSNENSARDLKSLIGLVKKWGLTLVLLPVMNSDNFYSLDDMYEIVKSYGISSEEIITDREGLRKRLIRLKSGGYVLLRIDELARMKPYRFCASCPNALQCREGIFPIRLSSSGQLIPCMADRDHRIDILDTLRNRDKKGIATALEKISGWQT